MKLLYKPFALIAGLIGARIAQRLFDMLWKRIDPAGEPPEAHEPDATWGKVVGAAALQGATRSATRAAVDRASAKSFHHLTGVWPQSGNGDSAAEPTDPSSD